MSISTIRENLHGLAVRVALWSVGFQLESIFSRFVKMPSWPIVTTHSRHTFLNYLAFALGVSNLSAKYGSPYGLFGECVHAA